MDKISIIIPVFNAEKFIDLCIGSILAQTYTNFELILIDDGSIDSTPKICDSFVEKDTRIRVIHQGNKGIAEARNIGLKNISGDFVCFIDHDDWIHPQYLEFLLQAIKDTGSDIAMCLYNTVWIQDFKPETNPMEFCGEYKYYSRKNLLKALFSIPNNISRHSPVPYEIIWAKMYQRKIVENLSFKSVWAEDAEFSSKVYIRIKSITLIPLYLYSWIQRSTSTHLKPCGDMRGYIQSTITLLENFPHSLKWERGIALKRVMLITLASRYNTNNFPQYSKTKEETGKLVGNIFKKYKNEFFNNPTIGFLFKTIILSFYYIPMTYNIFRYTLNSIPRLLKLFKKL